MREPLLLPLFCLMAGIGLAWGLQFSIFESAWPLFGFALCAAATRNKILRFLALSLAITMTGALSAAWHRKPPAPSLDVEPREIVLLTGCVVEPTAFAADRGQFTLELEAGARARVTFPVDGEPQQFQYGQPVEVEARVRPAHAYRNPGAFDYAAYLARRDIYWTAFMPNGSAAKLQAGSCGSAWLAPLYRLRTTLLRRLDALYPGQAYATGMLEAVLIGETARLERIWVEDFKRTGTYHALVISGIHVTVLAGVLLFCLRLLPLPESLALLITALAAWIYAGLTGMTPPVMRAAGGFSLYLCARFVYRRTRLLNVLAAIGIVYLLCDPEQLREGSFLLSFLAVAALGALAVPLIELTTQPWTRTLRGLAELSRDPTLPPLIAQRRVELRLAAETIHLWTRLPQRVLLILLAGSGRLLTFGAEMMLVSAVIQIGLALPMALFFHRFSISGLTANLLIVPLMNAVVPLGFLAVATGWHWTAQVTLGLVQASAAIARWHVQWELVPRVPDAPVWFGVWFVASLLACAYLLRIQKARLAALAAILASVGVLVLHPWPPEVRAGQLELTALDVGQGDSLLLVFPQGSTMLIDGGGRLTYGQSRPSSFDTGEDVVSPYLWSRGFRSLDVVVATHAHQDHTGGLAALIANFRPRELWVGAHPDPQLLAVAASFKTRIVRPTAGVPHAFAGTSLQILAPEPGTEIAAAPPGNNDSLAFRITYGQRSFLLTGDLEGEVERRLLAADILQADVLKVGHHGSRTSTTPAFLEAVHPSLALISAGYQNSFGHPHPWVLERLAKQRVTLLRTDQDGAATVWTDGVHLGYETERLREPSQGSKLPILEGLLQ